MSYRFAREHEDAEQVIRQITEFASAPDCQNVGHGVKRILVDRGPVFGQLSPQGVQLEGHRDGVNSEIRRMVVKIEAAKSWQGKQPWEFPGGELELNIADIITRPPLESGPSNYEI